MSRFYPYSPEQGYLVPPNVADELGSDHLCFFIRQVIRQLDLSVFAQSYSPEGGMLYAPELMLSVWLRLRPGGLLRGAYRSGWGKILRSVIWPEELAWTTGR
jgi:hypothetical protein